VVELVEVGGAYAPGFTVRRYSGSLT